MHICHVNLASGYSGGENQTLALIRQQISLGYQLTVVANPKSRFTEEVKVLGCKVVTTSHFLRGHRSNHAKNAVIHVHEGKALYWALTENLLRGTPYIVTRRIDNPMKKRKLLRLGYHRASTVVGLSTEIVQQIKRGCRAYSVALIPSSPVTYPIDGESVAALKERFKGKKLVIQAGKMLSHKGFDVTIKAAKELTKVRPDIHIALLGDGPEMDALQALTTGLENISFEGKQHNMGDWFEAAHLQIHPSYSEGLGSVILEGMNAGLPVIASRCGGIPDIITHSTNGLLIEPGNSRQLTEYILNVIDDAELTQRFREKANQHLQNFDIEKTSQDYHNIYQTILNGTKA